MLHTAVLIPANNDHPLEVFSKAQSLQPVRHKIGAQHLEFANFPRSGMQLAFDEEAMLKDPTPKINVRAMRLWAALADKKMEDFAVPLVGDFVVLGLRSDGTEQDAPSVEFIESRISSVLLP